MLSTDRRAIRASALPSLARCSKRVRRTAMMENSAATKKLLASTSATTSKSRSDTESASSISGAGRPTGSAGIGVYDAGIIDNQPVESHVRRFEEEALTTVDDVNAVANKFLEYFQSNHKGVGLGFHVAGYKLEGKASVPYVLVGHTIHEPEV